MVTRKLQNEINLNSHPMLNHLKDFHNLTLEKWHKLSTMLWSNDWEMRVLAYSIIVGLFKEKDLTWDITITEPTENGNWYLLSIDLKESSYRSEWIDC